ncbi:hypothetical protein J8L88_01365 [Aquimarina sp. MMG015]|uniref:hypothetical protein n=1 Tax=unclassified Aquimarina TaxID=2627091 RepID=UPI000E49BE92|nr:MULTISPECIES: hypothetical protein [unclassified Aquimarina]AXT57277.1 hypothetical protein D1815_16565 [Aquimarina sp. AD1]MBQ4801481.1 hypothetical protein [Aquimarina sp. MMG015]RKN20794.1 hypothetical protein D7035_12810 [Aquimarina sp. AD1]
MKKLFYALPIIGLLFFISCDRDESNEIMEESALETEFSLNSVYDFHKDVTVTSEEGSTGIIRIHANNETALINYSSINLSLMEINANETLKQSLVRHNKMDLTQPDVDKETDDQKNVSYEESGNDIAFELIQLTRANPTSKYAINFNHPQTNTSKASWQYYTHYSSVGESQIAEIARHSVWRRVYYGLKYKAYSGSSWATIQNEWKKINNNQSFSHTKNPCYQFRMRVKTKKNSAYSVTFDY